MIMDRGPGCKAITSSILPAVRASVAETMIRKYNYSQGNVASMLGIAQVAVSKYMRDRCSPDVSRIKSYIIAKNLNRNVVESILNGKKDVSAEISKLCELILKTV